MKTEAEKALEIERAKHEFLFRMNAAPDMLAALERVGKYFEQHGTAETQGIASDVWRAIAKARGESR